MKVTIRKRISGSEKIALYLDYVQHGKRIKESLNLYLHIHPKNKAEVFENKKTNELVEHLRAEKLIHLQDHQYGTHRTDYGDKNFIDYFAEKMEDRRESAGNYGNWDAALKHLKMCYGEKLKMSQVNIET